MENMETFFVQENLGVWGETPTKTFLFSSVLALVSICWFPTPKTWVW